MATETLSTRDALDVQRTSVFEYSIFHGAYRVMSRMADGIVEFFASLAASQRAARHYDRLVHLSDAELAVRGIVREDIPHYVFEQNFNRH